MRAALLGLALLATPALGQSTPCEQLWSRLTELAAPSFALSGEVSPARIAGCLFTDIGIDVPGESRPDWQAESLLLTGELGWITGGGVAPDRLGLQLAKFRMVDAEAKGGFADRAGPNSVQLAAELSWDAASRTLLVDRLVVELPGANRLSLTAQLSGVDLASAGARQMSLASFALTEADIEVEIANLSKGLAVFSPGGVRQPTEGAMDAALRDLRTTAATVVASLPSTSFSSLSKAALTALIDALPNPSGRLTMVLRSSSGIGPTRFLRHAATGFPASMADAAPLFDGVTVDIGWTDAPAP